MDALKETLSLFLLREVEEELDDAGSVAVEVSLQIHDGTIPVVPNHLIGVRRVRDPFAAENLGMHADDKHLLVVGSVEDPDPPAFRQIAGGAPEKIVLQFGGAGMFKAEYLAALWVNPRHHMLDGTIFSGRVHRLKDQQDGIAVGCVEKFLQRAQLRNVLSQEFLIVLLRLVHGLHVRPPLPEADLVSFPHTKIL